jgi:nucleoside phosphorylase
MSDHQKAYLARFDHAIAVDMESIGVARALHDMRADVHYNPRWMCIRAISDRVPAVGEGQVVDLPAGGNDEERQLWKTYAGAVAGAFTRRILQRLLSEPREEHPMDPSAPAYDGWA